MLEISETRKAKMMKTVSVTIFAAVMALCGATFAAAADDPGYICTLRVGNSTADQFVSESKGAKKSGGRRTKKTVTTKTTSTSLSWPVTVSIHGKSLPASGSVMLECYFIGMTDGRTEILEERTIPVGIDEKGVFKTEVTSPTVKIVRTKTITKTRARRRRGGSVSVKSETSGTRVTGCIIQLMVNYKVESAFSSDSRWSRFAKKYPLPVDEILKVR